MQEIAGKMKIFLPWRTFVAIWSSGFLVVISEGHPTRRWFMKPLAAGWPSKRTRETHPVPQSSENSHSSSKFQLLFLKVLHPGIFDAFMRSTVMGRARAPTGTPGWWWSRKPMDVTPRDSLNQDTQVRYIGMLCLHMSICKVHFMFIVSVYRSELLRDFCPQLIQR